MSDPKFKSEEDLADFLMKVLGWDDDFDEDEKKEVMDAASLMRAANKYKRPSRCFGETAEAFQAIGVESTLAQALAKALAPDKRLKVEDYDGIPHPNVVPFDLGNGKSRLGLGKVAKAFGGVYDRETSLQQVRDGLKKLAGLRGNELVDKKDVPVLGVTATSESGKTEFLRYLFNNFCTSVRDKTADSIADQVLNDINSASPEGEEDFDNVLVLLASFNQESTYSMEVENGIIIGTTIERLLRSYKANLVMRRYGSESWKAQRFDCSGFNGICDLFPAKTAFVFCIDEVSKLKDDNVKDYRELMDELLSFSQTQLSRGQFVAIVATSLSVFDFGEVVLEKSGRALWPVRFPTHKPTLEQRARQWIKEHTNVGKDEAQSSAATTEFYLDVAMNVLQSESSIQVWNEIIGLKAIETRVLPINRVYSPQDHVGADEIFRLAARRALERPHYEHLKHIKEKATEVTDDLHGTIDLQKQVGMNVVTDWRNALGALSLPAWRILQLPIPVRGDLFTFVKNWVIIETHNLFFRYGPEETVKKWELATMAALEIRKAMFQVLHVRESPPSLREVYEGVGVHHNLSEEVLNKKAIKNAASEEYCELPTATVATKDEKERKKGPCFYYSKLENEPAVEGVFVGGFSALPIFFQMKLHSKTAPLQIKDWLDSASKRATDLGYKKFLVQLFVTGEIDAHVEEYITQWPSNSMVLGTVALRRLFKPFGSGIIQEILEQKNRNKAN